MNKVSKSKANEEIEKFFSDIKHQTPEGVKKIKKLASSFNIKLGDKRKLFCKQCLNPYVKDSSISIKDGFIKIYCGKCEFENRWKFSKRIKVGQYGESEECC
ncbi:MAG: hypothetical protein WDZ77_00770 [Candidatus Pacearchaeota archaeon]